jgi:hypothetical protein
VVAEKSEQRVEGRGRTLAPGQATDAEIEALDALDEPAGLIAAEDDDTRDEMTIELRSDAAAGDAGARPWSGRWRAHASSVGALAPPPLGKGGLVTSQRMRETCTREAQAGAGQTGER